MKKLDLIKKNKPTHNQRLASKPVNLLTAIRPSLWRRIAAGFYDLLLLFGVLCMVVLITSLTTYYFGGESALESMPYAIWFKALLITIIVSFFVLFWYSGQTLGMLAWRMYLYRDDGHSLTLLDALIRFLALNLTFWIGGFLWSFFRRDNKTLHDLISKSSPVIPTGEIHTDENDPYSMLNYGEH